MRIKLFSLRLGVAFGFFPPKREKPVRERETGKRVEQKN